MDFREIAQRFEASESGTDSFKQFYRDAFALMKKDSENAGLYFIVATAARSYVHRYEDQAVSPSAADLAKNILIGFNARIINALRLEPAHRLRVLGEIAVDYEWKVGDF